MQNNCAEGFKDRIACLFEYDKLEQERAVVFGLTENFTIAYFNPYWTVFAQENGGQPAIGLSWGIGSRYFDAIPDVLHDYYLRLFASAAQPAVSKYPTTHLYECSSPDTFRKFAMQLYALPEKSGFIVVNSLVVEVPYNDVEARSAHFDIHTYRDSHGIIHQCCHCRKIKAITDGRRWDWIPVLVKASHPDISHTICPVCFGYYHR
ncbi:MAG TPA: hypothetical protein PLF22_03090 [Pseudomonadales bacterium]|nr:hypothetical protein [Pseudomonadales bacterium]